MTRRRATASLLMTFFLTAIGLFAFLTMIPATARASTLYVGGVGPGNYTTIQAAVDAAGSGNTVYVYNGTYRESVNLTWPIRLVGEDSSNTIIDGGGVGTVVTLHNVRTVVTGFTIRNAGPYWGGAGILLDGMDDCYVGNNTIINNTDGISGGHDRITIINNTISLNRRSGIDAPFAHSMITNNTITFNSFGGMVVASYDGNTISGNNISSNQLYALHIDASDGNVIDNNTISDNEDGFWFYRSNYNTVTNNTISNSSAGILLEESDHDTIIGNTMIDDGIYIAGGSFDSWYTHTIDTTNTVNGRPVYYLKDLLGGSVPSDAGEAILVNSSRVQATGLHANNGTAGIEFGYSSNMTIVGNDASNNSVVGIYLFRSNDSVVLNNSACLGEGDGIDIESDNIVVSGNNASDNDDIGIFLLGSRNATVANNTILGTRLYGLAITSSNGATVVHNNISGSPNHGIRALRSDNNTFSWNVIYSNRLGLTLDTSDMAIATNNSVFQNMVGIDVEYADGGYFSGNNLTLNAWGSYFSDSIDNEIVGNEVSQNDHAGIYLIRSNYTIIAGNDLVGNGWTSGGSGMLLDWSNNNSIIENVMSGNGQGLYLARNQDSTVANNSVNGNGGGMQVAGSTNITFTNNTMVDDSFYINGGLLQHWNSHSIDTSNKVNGRPVRYWKDVMGGAVPQDAGQTILANVTGILVQGQNVSRGTVGVELGFSSLVRVANVNASSSDEAGFYLYNSTENIIENNSESGSGIGAWVASFWGLGRNILANNSFSFNGHHGVFFLRTDNNTFIGNELISNENVGIWLYGANNNTIVANNITANAGFGAYLRSASNNLIYHNLFDHNGNQSYDDGANAWDNGYPSGGNSWSDYNGTDDFRGPNQDQPGPDGIGDSPYNVSGGGNADRYPLMGPYVPGLLPDLVVTPGDISFSPAQPFGTGSPVLITAKVLNLGPAISGATTVKFYDGVPPSQPIGSGRQLATLPPGGSAEVSVNWTPMAVGSHDICVTADPDNLIQETNETNNTACVAVDVVFSLRLTPGHRLMSIPLIAANDSIEDVLSSMSGHYDSVRWYDPVDSVSQWKSYVPGRSYNSLLQLDNTMGFWINITSNCSLAPSGLIPTSTAIELHEGWNLVGFPSFNLTYTVADLKAALGLGGVIVEAFDPSAAPYYLQQTSDGYAMKAGDGYWIYVPADATWILNG